MTRTDNRHFYGLLALTAAIWGLQPLFIKLVVAELTPTTLTAVRYAIIVVFFFVIVFWRGAPVLPRRDCLLPLICMGLTGVAFNNIAQFSGLQYSSVGNATLIGSTTPASTALLAAVFLREKLMPIEWLGILSSLLGTLFLVSHGSLDMILSLSFNRGDLLFFACQQGWAIYSLIGVRVMTRLSALTATTWAGVFGVGWTVLYGLTSGELRLVPASTTCWLALGYVVFLGGIFAMLAWNLSLKAVGAGRAAIFLNLMPLAGVTAGVVLLDEPFVWQQCFGAVGMLAGIYILTHSHQIMRYTNRRLLRRAKALSHLRRPRREQPVPPWQKR
ncbi:DMT family transporter [uncultured Desulfovibrio sp.]|uniref:DMT family transporter n=1 Tax=Candidatus Desulfovibrio intestinavium TaxID=2838534 RepID=A0A9D2HQC1_9BACT|nr:DMT family transporter [uncultured Desulfovibrio sp.]HJA79608.1 DMT family transporter [Candidatus Desulfovibrio intestinavium]